MKDNKIPEEISIDVRKFAGYVKTFASDHDTDTVFFYLKQFIQNELNIKDFDTEKFRTQYDS